jgi:hypothetical protein
MRGSNARTLRWAAAAIMASAMAVAAVHRSIRNADAAKLAVDAYVDCALYATQGDTCEREEHALMETR